MKALAGLFDIVPGWVWAAACCFLVGFGAIQQLRVDTLKARLSAVSQALADERAQFDNKSRICAAK